MGNANDDNLLEILVMTRTVKALDNAGRKSKDYKDTLKKQDKVLDRLDNAGLDEEQKSIVDKAISASIGKEQTKTATELAYAEIISYNKKNLERELQNESRQHNKQQNKTKRREEEL